MPNMDRPQPDQSAPPLKAPDAQDLQALVAMKKLQEMAQEAQRASRRNLIFTSVIFMVVLAVLAGVMLLGFSSDESPIQTLAQRETPAE